MLTVVFTVYAVAVVTALFFWMRASRTKRLTAQPVLRSASREIFARQNRLGVCRLLGKGEFWFLQRSSRWYEPCLDTTHFGYEALRAIDKILNTSFCTDLLRDKQKPLQDFVLSHFDESLGGFKYNVSARHASLYGTYIAIRLLSHFASERKTSELLGQAELIRFIGRDKADAIGAFVDDCRAEQGGFCQNRYYWDEPTVADCDIALLLLESLGRERPADVPLFVVRKFQRNAPGGTLGFANLVDEKKPYSCATHFALRVIAGKEGLERTLGNEKTQEIKEFWRQCRNEDGGFAAYPGGVSSLAYTHLAFVDRKHYFKGKNARGTDFNIDISATLDYVLRAKVNGGYMIECSEPHPPDIHATRAAMEVLRFASTENGVGLVLEPFRIKSTVDFILEHFGCGDGTFKGF